MKSAKIVCANCGQEITKERVSLENLIKCPVCDDILPRAGDAASDASPLKVRQNRSLNEAYQTCPSCHGLNPENATLCTSCGYNFVTGKKMKTVYQKKRDLAAWKNPAIILFCILGLLLIWFFRSQDTPPDLQPEAAEQRLIELQKTDFQTWKSAFEVSYPLLKSGDEMELSLKTGRVIRGQIVNITADDIILFSAMGRETIPLADLTEKSRVQISPQARRDFIQRNRDRIMGQ